MAVSGALITNNHVIFPTVAAAEATIVSLIEAADEGETFVIVPNPIAGKTTAIIARYYEGAFEGYF